MMRWKKKSKIEKLHQLIKTFNILTKQCYHTVWNVKKTPDSCKDKKVKRILLSKCAVCGSRISRFITEQEAFGIISYLAKILINISIIGPIF